MFTKIASWIKSVFTKDNVKRFIHEAELSVVATASTTVNGFVNDPANQACTVEAQLRREPGRRPPESSQGVTRRRRSCGRLCSWCTPWCGCPERANARERHLRAVGREV